MKTNTVILILLGITIACQAQTTNPPASQKPAQSRAGFAAGPEDALISGAPSSPASGPFATKGAASGDVRIIRRQDGSVFVEDVNKGKRTATDPTLGAGNGNVRTLSRDAAVELARDLAKKGRYAEARALLNDEMQTAAPPKPAVTPNLALVFPKNADRGTASEPDASQRLSLTADPATTGTLQLTSAAVPAPFVTRLYSLKALITKAPAEIDDDAHNKKASDAYKAKVEALIGWVRKVLEHSEPAGASFAFSPEAGAFVVKATEAQHDALTQSVAMFEDNYGK